MNYPCKPKGLISHIDPKLFAGIGQLESLKDLNLLNCGKLKSLPEGDLNHCTT